MKKVESLSSVLCHHAEFSCIVQHNDVSDQELSLYMQDAPRPARLDEEELEYYSEVNRLHNHTDEK